MRETFPGLFISDVFHISSVLNFTFTTFIVFVTFEILGGGGLVLLSLLGKYVILILILKQSKLSPGKFVYIRKLDHVPCVAFEI